MYKYKALKVSSQKIDEHRHIMQQFLNRKLKRNEVVHHMDNNPRNNKIENLKLMKLDEHCKIHGFGTKIRPESRKLFNPDKKAVCRYCGKEKEIEQFCKNRCYKSGYRPMCKLCEHEQKRKYRLS
jgi:hypothetical protein